MNQNQFDKRVNKVKRPVVKIPKNKYKGDIGMENMLKFLSTSRNRKNYDILINSSQVLFLAWAQRYEWFDEKFAVQENALRDKTVLWSKYTGPLRKAGLIMRSRLEDDDLATAMMQQDSRVDDEFKGKGKPRRGRIPYRYTITQRGKLLVKEFYRYLRQGEDLSFMKDIPLADIFSERKEMKISRDKQRKLRGF